MSKNVNFKNLSNLKFGYLTAISIDETMCNGCGLCVTQCHFGALDKHPRVK